MGMLVTGSIIKPADFHFDFHGALPQPNYTTVTLSPTKELGPERVTRTVR